MKNMKINQLVVGVCQTNCYIIYNKDTNEAMIVDPGDQAEDISMRCRMLGVVPKAILLTHGHFDHMMAAGKLKEEFHIPIYAAEKEVPLLADARANLSAMWARPVCIKPDCLVKEGDELDICGFSITVIETPGHTIGGVCFYIPEEEVLLSGDTLFCGSLEEQIFQQEVCQYWHVRSVRSCSSCQMLRKYIQAMNLQLRLDMKSVIIH